ncbi:MAG: phosphodiester glycosidase family protein, partial [Lachnospiraceae bacterium]|nr:phosphodiester glycosidase family protein [Lachnospiraceae bacterium]
MKRKKLAKGLSILLAASLTLSGIAPASVILAESYEAEIPEASEWEEEISSYQEDEDDASDEVQDTYEDDDYSEDDYGEDDTDEPGTADAYADYEDDDEYADDDAGEAEVPEAEAAAESVAEEPEYSDDELTESAAEPFALGDIPGVAEPAADWETFMTDLRDLETYANAYAAENGGDADRLMVNYIRTGVERYQTGEWTTMAGTENTAFTAYVLDQDILNGTTATGLRGIESIQVPNGEEMEFSHMFGLLDIALYNNGSEVPFDLGSWAGDICDLIFIAARHGVTETETEELTQEVQNNYFRIEFEDESAFSEADLRGDLDGYFIASKLLSTTRSLRSLMESYYTASLNDTSRAVFFLKNRFAGSNSKEAIRKAVYKAYSANSGCSILESKRGVDKMDTLRTASCYAFADYMYELAKDQLPKTEEPLYTVFSSTTSTLAPGVTQTVNYATNAYDKQIVYYIAKADVSREDVQISANYAHHDASKWNTARITDQMAQAKAFHSNPDDAEHYIEGFEPIVGINADYYNMNNGQPAGALAIDGKIYKEGNGNAFFAILKDGTPIIADGNKWKTYRDQIEHAVSGAQILIRDGKIQTSLKTSANNGYPETCVGITEDGQVVFMAIDGRQEPFSAGGSAAEFAMIMYEAGCVYALGLDGGGSTTFAAKQEGADHVSVVN